MVGQPVDGDLGLHGSKFRITSHDATVVSLGQRHTEGVGI